MSKTVDQRVVEMQFNNQNFEKNVSTTMSTLDKLKQKLHFPGATKGLENVNAAAKRVDMSGLSNAVDKVGLRFNAMYTIADQALRNITNSAMAAGKRIVSALTIDPVKTGFQEYETQINAVQTILANTESKGTTIDDVNRALEELNKYADKTIYNFTEMTRNIGTFTAAGVDLDTSVNAIQGIANLAAVSGSTSQQASTAMYQLSQALSSGTVKLMDWNSVVNAGMGGEVFQNALKETARIHGVAIDSMIEEQGSFRETLSDGWLTSEILTETLQKFTLATEGLTEAEIEANREMLRGKGYTEEQIEEIFKLGNTATNAATKVKTFTQLWDVLKEAAQSGWSQSWKTVIGDFEEAKALLTPLADTLTGFINGMSDARNRVLEIALDFAKPWTALQDKLSKIKDVVNTVSEYTDKVANFQDIVNRVWMGEFNNWGDDPDRRDLLAKAGYDHRVVQELVNLGEESWHANKVYQLSTEEIEAAHKKFGLTMESSATETKTVTKAFEELSDQKLKDAGLTEEEIRLYRALEQEAKRQNTTIQELSDRMANTNGRDILISSLKDLGNTLSGIGKAAKDAWVEIFDPPSVEVMGIRLYGVIERLKEFTKTLRLVGEDGKLNENGEKIQRTFKGIFAAIDIVLTLIGGPLKIAFKILTQFLGVFGFNVLDLTAAIGDGIVGLRDWLDSVLDFTAVFEKMKPHILQAVDAVKKWFKELKNLEFINKFVSSLRKAGDAIKEWFKGLKEADNIPKYIIEGLANGLRNGISIVVSIIAELGRKLIESIKKVLGIHSPSTVFFEIGENVVMGLFNGLKEAASLVWELLKTIGFKCIEIIKEIDLGQAFAAVLSGVSLMFGNKILNIVAAFVEPLESVGDMMEDLGDMFEGIGSYFKGAAWNQRAKAIKNLAVALLIVVSAALLLTLIPEDKLVRAIATFGVLMLTLGYLVGLTFAMKMLNGADDKISASALSLMAMSASMLILSFALKKIADIKPENLKGAIATMFVLEYFVMALIGISTIAGPNADKAGRMILKIALAMLMVLVVVKIASKMNPDAVFTGLMVVGVIELLMLGLIAISKIAGASADKAGAMIFKMSLAMLVMLAVIKLASKLKSDEVVRGTGVIALVGVLFGALIAVSKMAGANATKAGTMLLLMSFALLITTLVIQQLAGISDDGLKRSLTAITVLGTIFGALIAISKGDGKDAAKVGVMLISMSAALLILSATVVILSLLNPSDLVKALATISILGIIFGALIGVTKIAQGTKDMSGVLMRLIIAVGVMALAMVALSFLDPNDLRNVTAALSIVIGAFALLIGVTNFAKDTKSMQTTLFKLVGVVAILAGVIAALTLVDTDKAIPAVIALSILLTALSANMILLSHVGKNSISVSKNMLPLLGVVAGLAAVLGVMTTFSKNLDQSITAAIALSILALAMSAVMVVLSTIKTNIKDAALGAAGLLLMAVPLIAFVGVLATMQNVKNVMANVVALTVLATAMTVLLIPLSLLGALVTASGGAILLGIAALLLMAVPLIAFVGVLACMQNIKNAAQNVKILTDLSIAMTILLVPLSILGALIGATGGIMLLGIAALLLMAVPLIAFVGVLATMQNIQNAEANAKLLTDLMIVMSDVLFKVSLVAPLAVIAVYAMTALMGVIVVFGLLATAIGALVTQFPQLEDFIDAGIPILEKLASGIGSVIGHFVTGFAGEVMTLLPELGTRLSEFMANVTPFIEGAKTVDEKVLAGVGILAGAVLALTAVDLISGVASFLQGGSSFADLGTELSKFMNNAMPFILGASLLNADMMAGVKALAETVMILTAADVINGLTSWLTGGSSLADFGAQLGGLGTNMSEFAANLGTFGEEQVRSVTCAAEAIRALSEAAKEIPNEGGLLAAIVGDNDIGTFGEKLPVLGKGIQEFASNLEGFGDDQLTAVTNGAEAVRAMAEVAEGIPNEGGWLAAIVGDNDIGTFGEKLPGLGANIKAFADNLEGFGDDQITYVENGTKAIKAMAEVANEIPNSGGWISAIVGDNDIATFADKLPGIGTNIKGFADSLDGFGDDQISAVTNGASAIKAMSDIAKDIPTENADWIKKLVGDDSLAGFAAQLPGIGDNLGKFATGVGSFDEDSVTAVDTAISMISSFSDIAKKIEEDDVDAGDLVDFTEDLATVGEYIDDFVFWTGDIDSQAAVDFASMMKTLVGCAKTLIDNDMTGDTDIFTNFGESITVLGEKLATFTETTKYVDTDKLASLRTNVSNVVSSMKYISEVDADKVNTACSSVDEIVAMLENISTVDAASVDGFSAAIGKLGETSLDSFISAFQDAGPKIKTAGSDVVNEFINAVNGKQKEINTSGVNTIGHYVSGIDSAKTKASTSFAGMLKSCITAISGYYTSFYNAGYNLVQGFADGISDNSYIAAAKARAMAKAAAEAAEDELDINSPSKVFRKIGMSVPEGFAQGIDRLGRLVRVSSTDMADSAVMNVKNAISKLANVVTDDIDTQPTIRPVIDLTDVRSGASAIGSMIGGNRTLSVDTRTVGRISESMNRIQNGKNSDDLVSTMKDLRKDIANMPRNSYNINGVSYEEASDVAEAFQTIIRAAKVERRK